MTTLHLAAALRAIAETRAADLARDWESKVPIGADVCDRIARALIAEAIPAGYHAVEGDNRLRGESGVRELAWREYRRLCDREARG